MTLAKNLFFTGYDLNKDNSEEMLQKAPGVRRVTKAYQSTSDVSKPYPGLAPPAGYADSNSVFFKFNYKITPTNKKS